MTTDVSHEELLTSLAQLPAEDRQTVEEYSKWLRVFLKSGGELAVMAAVLVVSELVEDASALRH